MSIKNQSTNLNFINMKTCMHTIFFILVSSVLFSQDLSGQWSGNLNVQGTQFRIVFHVVKTNSGYNATLDSPDQNATGIPVTSATLNYPSVKIVIADLGMVYEGAMTDNIITGSWKQAGQTFSLVLVRDENIVKEKQ
jgi:hypothetical protein